MSYIVYRPGEDFPEGKVMRCEIWSDLPPYPFASVEIRDGKNKREALRAEGKRYYVWVSPSALAALRAHQLVKAHGFRNRLSVKFFGLVPIPKGTPEEYEKILGLVRAFNEQKAESAKPKPRRQTPKKKGKKSTKS